MGISGSASTSEPKKRKGKEKAAQSASAIPDLNGNVLDMNSSGNTLPEGSHVSPEIKPKKKRVNKFDVGPNGEPLCGNVLLNFAPGSTLPSLQMLVSTFSRFGLLKESELQVLSDSSVQIVYERRTDARFAYQSLERGHSFGESLISFTSDCMPPPSSLKKELNIAKFQMLPTSAPFGVSKKVKMAEFLMLPTSASNGVIKNQAMPSAPIDASKELNVPKVQVLPTSASNGVTKNQAMPSAPIDASKNQNKPTETHNIAVIKQKSEMMKLTLEKSGDSISPEVKAMLENEIKAFLDKINSMEGSSS